MENLTEDDVKKKPELIGEWAPWFVNTLNKANSIKDVTPWAATTMTIMREHGTNDAKSAAGLWLPVVNAAIKWPDKNISSTLKDVIGDNKLKKNWNWKVNFQEARNILVSIRKVKLPTDSDVADNYGDIVVELVKQLKQAKNDSEVAEEVADILLTVLERKNKTTNRIPSKISYELVLYKDNHEMIPGFLQRFLKLFSNPNYPWDDNTTMWAGLYFFGIIINAFKDGQKFPEEVNKYIVVIFRYAIEGDVEYIDINGDQTIYNNMAHSYLIQYISKLQSCKDCAALKPILPGLMRLEDCEEETMLEALESAVLMLCSKGGFAVLAPYADHFVKWLREGTNTSAAGFLGMMYAECDGFNSKTLEDVYNALIETDDDSIKTMLSYLFSEIAKKQPDFFTEERIDRLLEEFTDFDGGLGWILGGFNEVAMYYPENFGQSFIDCILKRDDCFSSVGGVGFAMYITNIAVGMAVKREKLAQETFDALLALAKNSTNPLVTFTVLEGIRTIGGTRGVEMFKPHRAYFEKLKAGAEARVKDTATSIIDALEGRSLKVVTLQIKKQKVHLCDIDERMTTTEIKLGNVKGKVGQHHEEIRHIVLGLTDINQRVDELEEDLEETQAEVEEIDNKMVMKNAPSWSRDLTKLMNHERDDDWRLLASKLGYNSKDIKGWATQHDPCMALISEWYVNRNTREANQALLAALQEMERFDGACIVENAMKSAGDIAEEDERDYTSPPPIFLSYQWGCQEQVKLIQQHLIKAGYECWMDIGQMGSGDKLIEKIDSGIRGANVVICCISDKYTSSPNCIREVNLCVTLGKPMIPLLMEKMSWPPKGSMGPILSEYLFVRFFQRAGEETNDERFWPGPKFQEMLMQLNIYKCLPDENLITQDYKEWWKPIAEEIIIPKRAEKKQTTAQQKKQSTKEENKSPDIFLSYQWGKQPQVKALYKCLTQLGIHCWMDIYQMGGGDSLYDKIDRGVRGCSVVLSMVTTKYAVSANCRREVSLADSLKKPIIPLMLEEIDWPPPGPMSKTFTQLTYINFYRDENIQMTWLGETFKEVTKKMCEYAPTLKEMLEDEEDSAVRDDQTAMEENTFESSSTDERQTSQEHASTDMTQMAQPSANQAQPHSYQTQQHTQQQSNQQMYQGQTQSQPHMYQAQPQMYKAQPQMHQNATMAPPPPNQYSNPPTQQRTTPVNNNRPQQKESSTCNLL